MKHPVVHVYIILYMKHHPVFQLSNKLQHKSYELLSVLLFLDTQIEMGWE